MKRAYSVIVVCQVCAAIAAVAALRWLATYVDPETFGRYSLYQSVIAVVSLFLISWPNAAVLRFGREEWTRDGRLGLTLAARMVLFIASIVVASVIAWTADAALRRFLHITTSPFLWVVAGLVVTPAAELAIYISQAVGRPQAYGYSPMITRCGFLVGVVLIPLRHQVVSWTYLAAWMITASLAATTIVVATLPRMSFSGFRVESPTLVAILKYSWTLPFAAMTTYIVNWVDSWVIRGVRGVGPVGVYNWAYQTTAIAALAFAPIAAILTPRVIDARVGADQKRIDRYARSLLPIIVLVSAAVALGMAVVFPALAIVASPAYADAYPVILILLAALPFQLLGYLVTPLGNAYERLLPKFVLVGAIVAISNAIGDLVLVPRIGISGAALSTATAFALGGVLQADVVRSCADFSALWRYTAPAWILIPAVVALLWAGPRVGGELILMGVAAAACAFGLRIRRATPPLGLTEKWDWLMRLPRALTLSDVGPTQPL